MSDAAERRAEGSVVARSARNGEEARQLETSSWQLGQRAQV